jgi:predicted transcriptional regulator
MAANVSVSELTTMRDNFVTALTNISSSATSSYTLGDRTFTYEDRFMLISEIRSMTREIMLRTTGNDANCRGANRMDFRSWG